MLVACLLLAAHANAAEDPCHLVPSNTTFWWGAPSRALQCFDAIPLDDTIRTQTLDIINNLFKLYSFSDLVRANVPPYLLHVRQIFRLSHSVCP